jgi:hypothetical protein
MTFLDEPSPNVEPRRLSAGDADDPVLDELGRWFASAPPARGLDATALGRVARRLDGTARKRRPVSFRSVALGFAFITIATASAAMWQGVRPPAHWFPLFARAPEVPAEIQRKSPAHGHATPRLVPTPELPAPEVVVPTPNVAVPTPNGSVPATNVAVPAPNVAVPRAAPLTGSEPAAPDSAAAPNVLALESAALERALTALRRDHDPARALGLLERYAAEYPAGVLRVEADVARIDAHLALHDEPAALALLERVPLERVGRGLELRLVRAELLAKRDCRSALIDFDRVVLAHPARALDERALYGRANCRSELGDAAGAGADFDTYLSRYPDGRFAALVRSRRH